MTNFVLFGVLSAFVYTSLAGRCPVPSIGFSRAMAYAKDEAGCQTVKRYRLQALPYLYPELYYAYIKPTCIKQWNHCKNCEFWRLRSCEIYAKCICCCSKIVCSRICQGGGTVISGSSYQMEERGSVTSESSYKQIAKPIQIANPSVGSQHVSSVLPSRSTFENLPEGFGCMCE